MNKRIMNKIASISNEAVELKAEKVELSNIKELKAMISSNEGEVKNYNNFKAEFDKLVARRNVNQQQTGASMKETGKVLDSFSAKAKDLGLNPRDIKEYVDLSKSFSELSVIFGEYNTKYKFK